jgi:hypothetical protein
MQMTLFILWCAAIPVISMNLLIAFLGDTYTRVYEQREKAGYTELVRLILNLEVLFFWNRHKTEKGHLIFA